MSKKFDISDVKVGWTVQLNSVAWDVPRERFQGMWGKVETIHGPTLTVLLDGNMRVHFPAVDSFILDARPPEPAKDPFTVGEWVVALKDGARANKGELIQVSGIVEPRRGAWFVSQGWYLLKSRFRPATSEEIAAHMEKQGMAGKPVIPDDTHAMEESPGEACIPESIGCDAREKITFTVAGREFFIGQRVWYSGPRLQAYASDLNNGDELEICAISRHPGQVICRIVRTSMGASLPEYHVDFTPAPRHEWRVGDICRGEDPASRYVILKVLGNGTVDIVCLSSEHPILYTCPVGDLTFIRRTDLGE